ncbi:MAG: L-rhamnose mutarotase [Flavobacteriaceae bacterium]
MKTTHKKYCFALDLKEDKRLIAAYKAHHKKVWPEILQQIKETGILEMEIYQVGNRLFMIMETKPEFSLKNKEKQDQKNPKVQEWEALMSQYQQQLPFANPDEKWVLMDQIFKL